MLTHRLLPHSVRNHVMSLLEERPVVDLPKAIFWVAVIFSSYQIYTAAFSPMSSQVIRAIHVGFVIWLVYLLHPNFFGRRIPWLRSEEHTSELQSRFDL